MHAFAQNLRTLSAQKGGRLKHAHFGLECGEEGVLQKLASHIADAHMRAAEWEEWSRQASDASQRVSCLRLAKGWSQLAKSYEFVGTLERFLIDAHNQGWPVQIETLPRPPDE